MKQFLSLDNVQFVHRLPDDPEGKMGWLDIDKKVQSRKFDNT